MNGWLWVIAGSAVLWFAPVFPYRMPCADPPYDPVFLAEVSESWNRRRFIHLMVSGYPLLPFWQASDTYIDPEYAAPRQYAVKVAIIEVEQHVSTPSSYIRAAPDDVARLLKLHREIGTERDSCEIAIVGLMGDLPPETWAELRADPDWPD